MKQLSILAVLAIVLSLPAAVFAQTYTIGDNDGYGFGIADDDPLPGFLFDNRDASEEIAVDGSQFTDVTTGTSTFPSISPSPTFVIDLSGPISSGTFEFDISSVENGSISFAFNGINQGSFQSVTGTQGQLGSGVYSVSLGSDVITAINSVSQFQFSTSGGGDGLVYDYFQLSVTSVPEVSTTGALAAIGSLLAMMAFLWERRRVIV